MKMADGSILEQPTAKFLADFLLNQYMGLCKKYKVSLVDALPNEYVVEWATLQYNKIISKNHAIQEMEKHIQYFQQLKEKFIIALEQDGIITQIK